MFIVCNSPKIYRTATARLQPQQPFVTATTACNRLYHKPNNPAPSLLRGKVTSCKRSIEMDKVIYQFAVQGTEAPTSFRRRSPPPAAQVLLCRRNTPHAPTTQTNAWENMSIMSNANVHVPKQKEVITQESSQNKAMRTAMCAHLLAKHIFWRMTRAAIFQPPDWMAWVKALHEAKAQWNFASKLICVTVRIW